MRPRWWSRRRRAATPRATLHVDHHDDGHDCGAHDHGVTTGIRLGVRGIPAGAVVAADTSIHVDGESRPLRWFVMSEERLHTPEVEPSLRVSTVDGAPVVTQRISLPGGDASLTAWMVADDDGSLVLDFANESPRACALVIDGPATTSGQQPRPVDALPGVPATARSYSVGHRTTTRLVVGRGATDPARLAAADRVASGWVGISESVSRVDVPATTYATTLVAARARIAVARAHEWSVLLEAAPDLAVLGLAERTRMGESLGEWTAPVADAVARISRSIAATSGPHGRALRAVQQAAHALRLSDEPRAADDAAELWSRLAVSRGTMTPPPDPLAGHDLTSPQRFDLATAIDVAAGIEQRCVRAVSISADGAVSSGADSAVAVELFAPGFPSAWRGVDGGIEGVSAGPRHTLSFAMRWHGERLAVLWESTGPTPVTLTAPRLDPSWRVTGTSGDALLEVTFAS